MATATGLQDTALAARMRDAIRRLAIQTIDEERPPYRYGTVTAIYPDLRKVDVQFPGDTTSVPVKLLDTQPVSTGQVVQVSGYAGDRFVSGVIGQARMTDVTEADLAIPSGVVLDGAVHHVTLTWNPVTNASKYEVQFAEDSAFTVNVRTFYTTANTISLDNLAPGTQIWARVRAMNNANGAGLYATAGPVSVEDFPATGSDGSPPAASPDPVVTPGLGYLLAEWLPVSNVDPVTYEVHLSTVSGFTPSATTKVGETESTFFFAKRDATGALLAYDTTYFIRIVAKDPDGAAGPSAQGSGQLDRVDTGDVGVIDPNAMTDGLAPTSSPAVTVTPGIGHLYTTWPHVTNHDPLTYEVHVSTTSGFVPSSNTLVGETPSNWFFVRKQGPGAGSADLVYGATYYVRIVAKDADGAAAAGVQASAAVLRVQDTDVETDAITSTKIADGAIETPKLAAGAVTAAKITAGTITASEMAVGTITAASAILADAVITTAKIADLAVDELKVATGAITTAKIGDLQVSQAKIALLAVDTAQIADAAIETAKINNLAVTDAKISTLSAGKITAGTIGAHTITVSSTGAVQSSNYNTTNKTGWRIDGTSFTMYGGTIEGSSIIGATITGGLFRTASTGARIELTSSEYDRINFWNSSNVLVGRMGMGSWAQGSASDLAIQAPQGHIFLQPRSGYNAISQGVLEVNSNKLQIVTSTWKTELAADGGANAIWYGVSSTNYFYVNADGSLRVVREPGFVDARFVSSAGNTTTYDNASYYPPIGLYNNSPSVTSWPYSTTSGVFGVAASSAIRSIQLHWSKQEGSADFRYRNIAPGTNYNPATWRVFAGWDYRSAVLTDVESTYEHARLRNTYTCIKLLNSFGQVQIRNSGDSAYEDINASAFNVGSSEREKQNVVDARPALSMVRAVRVREWKREPKHVADPDADLTRMFPIIEELPADLKPLVIGPGPDEDTVDLGAMVGVLWKAVQELAARVPAPPS